MADRIALTREDLDGVLAWSLVRASRRAVRELTDVLRGHDITPVQFGVLAQLAVDPRLAPADLAREVLVRPQSLATALEPLEARGLLRRTGGRGRGRRSPVELTDAGRALLTAVWGPVLATNEVADAGIDAAQAAALNAALLRLARAAPPVPHGGPGAAPGPGGG